jgi:hypothetical protein
MQQRLNDEDDRQCRHSPRAAAAAKKQNKKSLSYDTPPRGRYDDDDDDLATATAVMVEDMFGQSSKKYITTPIPHYHHQLHCPSCLPLLRLRREGRLVRRRLVRYMIHTGRFDSPEQDADENPTNGDEQESGDRRNELYGLYYFRSHFVADDDNDDS